MITRPYTRPNGLKTIPFNRPNGLKTILSPAAHTRTSNIWEYPPPEGAISSDRKIVTNCDSGIQPYALGIAKLELGIIKQKNCNLSLKTNYCTEIDINLLLNTCNFHRKFRFIFSLILSENAPNVHFREAKFQKFRGGVCPRTLPLPPPSVIAPSALVPSFAGPTMGNSHYNITYLNQTKTFFFFSLQKSPPSVLYIDIYFKGLLT